MQVLLCITLCLSKVSLNEGAHQLRLYAEGPEGNEPMTATCIANRKHIPCATILIRLVKATLGPLGKPLEVRTLN